MNSYIKKPKFLLGIAIVADSVNTIGTLIDNNIRNMSDAPVQEISSGEFTARAYTPGRTHVVNVTG
jgi:hypothetical protein